MTNETYPCYVKIREVGTEELVELPTEDDGSMLLSTIKSQFPLAIGLRFKTKAETWRGLRANDHALELPMDGWGNGEYYITTPPKGLKRKINGDIGADMKKTSENELLSDLIVLGLPYATTDEDLKIYFEKYGELQHYEVKMDAQTQKSKGFGFIRYKTVEAVEAVLAVPHTIDGRRCEVRFPKKEAQAIPTKLFVGRLPKLTTVEDLKNHFSPFGILTDVYIPKEFRGFGFVTFGSVAGAREALATTHVFKGNYLNVSHPSPKNKKGNIQANQSNGYYTSGYAQHAK